jgi:hypothetical protein
MNNENDTPETELPQEIDANVVAATTTLKREMPERLRRIRAESRSLERQIEEIWGEALDLYDLIVAETTAIGSAFVQQYTEQSTVSKVMLNTLASLHARACRTAHAIGVLMRAGYAMDALARWRTVHELAVVAQFIIRHGEFVAERYLAHEAIADVRWDEATEKYREQLGWESLTPSELEARRTLRKELITKYGESFASDYGWAASALNKGPKYKPTFSDLEQDVAQGEARPYYQLGSAEVHAGSKGIGLNGYVIDAGMLLLAGPSVQRLGAPGHATLISLLHSTVPLIQLSQTIEDLEPMLVVRRLTDEANTLFQQIEQQYGDSPLSSGQPW